MVFWNFSNFVGYIGFLECLYNQIISAIHIWSLLIIDWQGGFCTNLVAPRYFSPLLRCCPLKHYLPAPSLLWANLFSSFHSLRKSFKWLVSISLVSQPWTVWIVVDLSPKASSNNNLLCCLEPMPLAEHMRPSFLRSRTWVLAFHNFLGIVALCLWTMGCIDRLKSGTCGFSRSKIVNSFPQGGLELYAFDSLT